MLKQFAFVGADSGTWRVRSMTTVAGAAMPEIAAIDVAPADQVRSITPGDWRLDGVISNLRYATRSEVTALRAKQEGLGRPHSTRAAMIPIRKSPAWWDLAQDERRAILEDQSRHTALGLGYLPAIARQLYHCRDLDQPFDFVTWFEFAPESEAAFDELVARLRASSEWAYVDREIDIRLERAI